LVRERKLLNLEFLQFQQVIDTFGHFFAQLPKTEQDFGTKRLHWTYPRHSTCTVVGNFERGSKQIFVTLGQAIVLLLFNDYSALRFDEIVEKSGISADNLKLLLLPIARSGMLVKDTTVRNHNIISLNIYYAYSNIFICRPISSVKATYFRSAMVFLPLDPSSIFQKAPNLYV
jgi:hypothetical protein